MQDDGGTASGGVDTDATVRTITLHWLSTGIIGNHAPAGADKSVNTVENATYTIQVQDFGFTDPQDNPANLFKAVKITNVPAPSLGVLFDNGIAITSTSPAIPVSDITTGNLRFVPASNVTGSAQITFQVQDDGGTNGGGVDLDQSPNTLTIGIGAVNHAPEGTDGSVSTLEDKAYTFAAADFPLTDVNDSPANTLNAVKITSLPAAGTLFNNNVQVFAGQFVTANDIASGSFKFVPAPNANGGNYASFTFQVQDNGGTANGGIDLDPTANTMRIAVTSVNDAPSGSDRFVRTVKNTAYVFGSLDFAFSDNNDSPANGLLAVKIASLPTPAAGSLTFNGNPATLGLVIPAGSLGQLRFTPATDFTGSDSFTFQVQDNGGTASGGVDLDPVAKTVFISVLPNDVAHSAPSGADKTIGTFEDTAYTLQVADFGFSDSDNPPDHFQAVRVASIPSSGTLRDNGALVAVGQLVPVSDITSGKLTFTPPANASGSPLSSFTFQVQDDGGTQLGGSDTDPSANTVTFNVTAVNDAPSGADKAVATSEDAAYVFTAADFGFSDATDSPANTMTAVKIASLPAAGILTNGGVAVSVGQPISVADLAAGNFKFLPAANASGSLYANFTFQVQDNGLTANGGVDTDTTPNTIVVNVNSVNDAPLAQAARSAWPTARPRPARSTRSSPPTSASAIPATARPTASRRSRSSACRRAAR